jgi:hypothetical protein
MTFLHLSLLAGGLLAVAPVVMHLLGRKQPKVIVFPAIRFVRQTAIQAQRGWTIKRWLLLALRVLLVLLAALAFASPRVPSSQIATIVLLGLVCLFALIATAAAVTSALSQKSRSVTLVASLIALLLWGGGGVWFALSSFGGSSSVLPNFGGPIAAAIVIDTSPTMDYMYQNKTRLDVAKETASWLMDRLPIGSQIAVVNSDNNARLVADRMSANRLLDKTLAEGRASGMVQRITNALEVLKKAELDRREVYVLSDLNVTAWRDVETSTIATMLAEESGNPGEKAKSNILVQLIDVSIPQTEIKNWGIQNFTLSQQTSVPGASVTIACEVEGSKGTPAEQMTIEFAKEPLERELVVRGGTLIQPDLTVVDRQLINVPESGATPVSFEWKDLVEGVNHAQLRIARSDPLSTDNIVYLTVETKAGGQSVVVSDDRDLGEIIGFAIETEFATIPKVESYVGFSSLRLDDITSIVLYDPTTLDADTSDRLEKWVREGGGLMIIMGGGFASAEQWNDSPVSRLLPGVVKRVTRRAPTDRSVVLTPSSPNHPMWSVFQRPVDEVPWATYPIHRHWDLEDLKPSTSSIMRFTQSELPAIVEEYRNQGRIITWAVPYPDPVEQPWSELFRTTNSDVWSYGLFAGALRYMASPGSHQFNYLVDQPAIIENKITVYPQKYSLFDPKGEQSSVESGGESLVCNYTRFPGPYRLKGLKLQGFVIRGFSVNVDRKEIRLERVPNESLDAALGKDNFRIARERKDIEFSLGEGRHGRELTPYILVMVVMLFMAEQTMASRFYQTAQRGEEPNRRPTLRGAA